MSASSIMTSGEVRCARHPATATRLRCGRCGTPICPRCVVSTEVGQRCPDCGRGPRLPTFQVAPGIVLRAWAAGLAAATIIGYLWSLAPAFAFWMGLLMGFITGEVVARAGNVKRGPLMTAAAVAAVLLGFALGFALLGPLGRGAGAADPLAAALSALLRLRAAPFTLIMLALAAVIAGLRQRG